MKIPHIVLAGCGLLLAACLKPKPKAVEGGPVFRFSAEYDTSLHAFEVMAKFESTTDDDDCRFMSYGLSKRVPKKMHVPVRVPAPGKAVEVPLTLRKNGKCEWGLTSVLVQEKGAGCAGFHHVSFLPTSRISKADPSPSHPDTVEFTCRKIPDSQCLDCQESDGEVIHGYALKTGSDSVHFQVGKE